MASAKQADKTDTSADGMANGPLGDWGLASQAHELESQYLGSRRGFADHSDPERHGRSNARPRPVTIVL